MTSNDKANFWQAHFDSWKRSGLTQPEYCKQHDLTLATFGYWRKKLKAPAPASNFAPLGAISEPARERVVINLPMGIYLEVDTQSLGLVLPTVIAALQASH